MLQQSCDKNNVALSYEIINEILRRKFQLENDYSGAATTKFILILCSDCKAQIYCTVLFQIYSRIYLMNQDVALFTHINMHAHATTAVKAHNCIPHTNVHGGYSGFVVRYFQMF